MEWEEEDSGGVFKLHGLALYPRGPDDDSTRHALEETKRFMHLKFAYMWRESCRCHELYMSGGEYSSYDQYVYPFLLIC